MEFVIDGELVFSCLELEIPDGMPDEIAQALAEANRCLLAKAPNACAVMIRRVVYLLDQPEAFWRESAKGREVRIIDSFGESRVITLEEEITESISRLRKLGNHGAHPDATSKRPDWGDPALTAFVGDTMDGDVQMHEVMIALDEVQRLSMDAYGLVSAQQEALLKEAGLDTTRRATARKTVIQLPMLTTHGEETAEWNIEWPTT